MSLFAQKRKSAEQLEEPPNFWASYSDLMAGMLMVFVLLLIVALFHYAEFNQRKEEVLETQEERLKSFHALQQELINKLSDTFSEESVSVDPNTGTLQIGSGILFGEGQATLRADSKQQLQKIFDAYVDVVLDPQFVDSIKQIEIEGHTNSNGTYLHNLELSQQRALTVMKEWLAHNGAGNKILQDLVIASGRSYAQLILKSDGSEDPVRSRRIEIKFRLKERELFESIYRDLEN